MESNSDFQSELLRTNGLLQASITELRYHCEVYRLSLRSICKVLGNVQKEQEIRLRCLTTSRPSYQSYLLNLSQKQALDRINNVVRKAATFINGYALVDKGLFQPPPPKPKSVPHDKRAAERNCSESDIRINPGPITQSACVNSTSATSATKNYEPGAQLTVTDNNGEETLLCSDRHEKTRQSSHSSKSSKSRKHDDRESVRRNEKKKSKKSSKSEQRKTTRKNSKSMDSHHHQIANSRNRFQNGNVEETLSERRKQSSLMNKSHSNQSPSERKTSSATHLNGNIRAAANKRARAAKEYQGRWNYKNTDGEQQKRRNNPQCATNLKKIHRSNNKNEIQYNRKESLASCSRSVTATTQGRGVARKYLFTFQKTHNFRDGSGIEKVRRTQLCKPNGTKYTDRKAKGNCRNS